MKFRRRFSAITAAGLMYFAGIAPVASEDIRIIAPYLGAITDIQKDDSDGIDLEDTKLIEGLYVQWINPELYQWNLFVYHSADLNYSTVWGGHFILDLYFGPKDSGGKLLAGAGIELMRFDMDAGDHIVPLRDFTQGMTVTVPYLRAGKYFLFGDDEFRFSVLPWAGVQPLWVAGSGSFMPPGPPKTVKVPLNDFEFDGIAGINLKLTLYRFLEIEGKYQAVFNARNYRSIVSAESRVFFTRNWGVTYRFKFAQTTSTGTEIYNMFGVVFTF